MKRIEPTVDRTDTQDGPAPEWGNVHFRPRRFGPSSGTPEDNAESRFWIGVMFFLLVVLIYPWYSYWVNTRLLTWELKAAGEEIGRQLEVFTAQMRQQTAATAARRQTVSRRQRIASVQIVGGIPGRTGRPIAIVRLGQSNLTEARPTICRQAETMMGMSLVGQVVRVQQHRGAQSTEDAGTIRC